MCTTRKPSSPTFCFGFLQCQHFQYPSNLWNAFCCWESDVLLSMAQFWWHEHRSPKRGRCVPSWTFSTSLRSSKTSCWRKPKFSLVSHSQVHQRSKLGSLVPEPHLFHSSTLQGVVTSMATGQKGSGITHEQLLHNILYLGICSAANSPQSCNSHHSMRRRFWCCWAQACDDLRCSCHVSIDIS